MLGQNPHIQQAQLAYDRAVQRIRSMDAAFRAKTGVDYNPTVTLIQFDRILQAILLHMALIDGDFHRLERKLIRRVGGYADLMTWLRVNGVPMTWAQAGKLTVREREVLSQRLPVLLEHTCNDFVRPLALADQADPADFLALLEGDLGEIAGCMARVDGTSAGEEMSAYVEMLGHLLTDRWKAILAEG